MGNHTAALHRNKWLEVQQARPHPERTHAAPTQTIPTTYELFGNVDQGTHLTATPKALDSSKR